MGRFLKRLFAGFVLFCVVVSLLFWLTGNKHMFRGLAYTYLSGEKGPTIDDGLKFPRDTVFAAQGRSWPRSDSFMQKSPSDRSLRLMDSLETAAFLVVYRDSVLYERYNEQYGPESHTNSFSMAKSVVGMLIGIAISEGKIESADQKVSDFIPELGKGSGKELRIRHLLQMSSGIDFGESYSDPFGFIAKAYYGYDLADLVMKYRVSKTPGQHFDYQGGDTQLLAIILERATGKKVADYCSEKLWSRIGAEQDAWWSVDEEGLAKSSCCYYSNARDFARFGKLYADSGRWEGAQVVPEAYVLDSWRPVGNTDEEGYTVSYYGYQWWLGAYQAEPMYMMRGIQGQYVIILPTKGLVVVRLGKKRIEIEKDHVPLDVYLWVDAAMELLKNE